MEQEGNKYRELGEKPVGRLLLQYAIPAIIAMVASSAYNIIDGIFIGQGVGPAAIMGLALVNPLMSLSAAFGAMVGVGGATLLSVKMGQRDYKTAKLILGNVIVMNVVVGIGLAVGILLFLDPILRFFGASDYTIGPARAFMQVYLLGNVFTHLYFGLNNMLRATGRPKLAMSCTIYTVVLNCVFAPLFIFVFDWGIRGAAGATLLAQMVMLCRQFHIFSDRSNLIHLDGKLPTVNLSIIHRTMMTGLPQLLINSCACLVAIIITRSMTHFGDMTAAGGDVAVGSYGISNRLGLFFVMAMLGLNQGMQPIAGYNFGARKYDRLLEVLKKAIFYATLFSVAGCLVCEVWATPLVRLFAKDSPELIASSARGLRIMMVTFPLVGFQIISTAFFQSIGYVGKSIFLSLSRQLLFLVPLLLVMPLVMPESLDGVWYAMPVSDAVAFCVALAMQAVQVRKLKALVHS